MRCALLVLAWLVVMMAAVLLRFEDLSLRPMHADEATGARITAQRMEGQGGQFNPTHYHGPLLADLAMPICRMRGESGWHVMSKETLRLVPALAGCLLVLLPLLARRSVGDGAALLAGALLATSPLLAYYSRMFIHEMLLTLFGVAALLMALVKPRWGLAGLMVGLMFAAKESFAISMLAWSAAALWLLWEERASLEAGWWRPWWRPLLLAASLALFTTLLCYTHGFSHWQGAWDAVRTFFVYQTVEGHDKPWYYYVRLLVWPDREPGVWWYGTPVAALALLAFVRGFHQQTRPELRRVLRFLGYSILVHLLIYSRFAYKTPWLACLPWAMTCLLAGCALIDFAQRSQRARITIASLVLLCLGSQWHQAKLACGRFDNDPRNPYAYVPTRRDVEGLERWLSDLCELEPSLATDRIAVVGRGYWPLPWYLRQFSNVGYWAEWTEVPADLERVPLVLAMPDLDGLVRERLEATHVAQARSLRNEVPVIVYVERGLWDRWKEVKEP